MEGLDKLPFQQAPDVASAVGSAVGSSVTSVIGSAVGRQFFQQTQEAAIAVGGALAPVAYSVLVTIPQAGTFAVSIFDFFFNAGILLFTLDPTTLFRSLYQYWLQDLFKY